MNPSQLLILCNTADPQSVQVASYYMATYAIPSSNLVMLNFAKSQSILPGAFAPIFSAVSAALAPRPDIQGIVITWTEPWRVGPGVGMSITSAFTLGYDARWYNDSGGQFEETDPCVLYQQALEYPFTDFGLRPSMMLAGTSFANVKALIDRSVNAIGGSAHAYLYRTTDNARSVRYPQMEAARDHPLCEITYFDNHRGDVIDNFLEYATDVTFYFTGLANVQHLDTLMFKPGSVADHLTSAGGKLTNTPQMSALRWLEAGASGSYGTVAEPGNMTDKFPNVDLFLKRYLSGGCLLDAYWQSVRCPGEGIFIGDPLTRPFA